MAVSVTLVLNTHALLQSVAAVGLLAVVPAPQGMQAVEPDSLANEPAGQDWH